MGLRSIILSLLISKTVILSSISTFSSRRIQCPYGVKVMVEPTYEEMSERACEILMKKLKKIAGEKEEVVLVLPTGRTPIRLYELLIERYKDDPVWGKVILVQLDEYVGASPEDEESFQYFLKSRLLNKLRVKRFIGINGGAKNLEEEVIRYNELLKELGSIDILVLGIGRNGHIAFNEPGFSSQLNFDIVELTEETQKVNGVTYEKAFTITVPYLLKSKFIMLLASGESKQEIIERTLKGPISKDIPASLLRGHPDCIFILDEVAATKLITPIRP